MIQKFFICRHCGNIVAMVKESGRPIVCCGENMKELVAGSVDANEEMHVPSYEVKENKVYVKIGEKPHPMTEDHYIQWISIQTCMGNQRKELSPTDKPEAVFALLDREEVQAVYAYCNIHGLWAKCK